MEEVRARHRKEQKDLQGRITSKKKNATKKTRKGINDECETLERELAERHQAELAALAGDAALSDSDDTEEKGSPVEDDHSPSTERAVKVTFDPASTKSPPSPTDQHARSKKPNRQKARLARRAAETESRIAEARKEAQNLPDRREQEMTAMQSHMERLQLRETFIRPDGHCLYSACATNIPRGKLNSSKPTPDDYRTIRSAAADFIIQHPDDFAAFVEEPLESYVTKIRDTAEWGGQLELQAIARSYRVNIHVLQADGRIEEITPKQDGEAETDIWLSYYRHSFGLGEHYNALSKV